MCPLTWCPVIPPADSTGTASGSRAHGQPVHQKGPRVPHRLRPHLGSEDRRGKSNLPSLTRRDANANSFFDMLDLETTAFLKPPDSPRPPDPTLEAGFLTSGPGTISPSAVTKA